MQTASPKRNSTSSKSPKSSSEKRRPLHERSDSQTNRSSVGGVSRPSEDSIYQKDPFPRLPSQVLPPKGVPLIFQDPTISGENVPPEEEGSTTELEGSSERTTWSFKGKEKALPGAGLPSEPSNESQSHLIRPVFHHDDRPGQFGRPPPSVADRFKQRQVKRGGHPLRMSPTEGIPWNDPWQVTTPERRTRPGASESGDTPMTSGVPESPPSIRKPSIASRLSQADSASQWESITDVERPRSSSNPEISTDAFLRDLIASGENVQYARLQKQSIPSLRSQSSSTRQAVPPPLRLHRKYGQSNLALRAANAAQDGENNAYAHQQRRQDVRISGNWTDEMQDTLPELASAYRHPSFHRRESTVGRRSNSISSTHSTATTGFYNLENDSKTAWASFYYRGGEGALRLSTPPHVTNVRSMNSLRGRTLTLNRSKSASISGPSVSGPSTSPDSYGYPDEIYIPRARPLQRQPSSLIGEPGPATSSDDMTIEPPSAVRSDSMEIVPVEETHRQPSDFEEQRRDEQPEPTRPPIRWSQPFDPTSNVPHLSADRRSSGMLSLWPAPSAENVEGFVGAVNRQIGLFCLGFLFPFAWMVAAFLPVPPRPHFPSQCHDHEAAAKQPEFTDLFAADDIRKFQKARWWRNLNRFMCVTGICVIAAVIACAITGTR